MMQTVLLLVLLVHSFACLVLSKSGSHEYCDKKWMAMVQKISQIELLKQRQDCPSVHHLQPHKATLSPTQLPNVDHKKDLRWSCWSFLGKAEGNLKLYKLPSLLCMALHGIAWHPYIDLYHHVMKTMETNGCTMNGSMSSLRCHEPSNWHHTWLSSNRATRAHEELWIWWSYSRILRHVWKCLNAQFWTCVLDLVGFLDRFGEQRR